MPDIDYKALADEARGSQAAQQPSGQTGPIDYQALANEARGSSDDDLIRQYGGDPAIIKKSAGYQQNLKQHGSGISFMLTNSTEHPVLQAIRNAPGVAQLGDVGHGAFDVISGMAQLARHGMGKLGLMSDADVQYADLLDRIREKDYVQTVRGGSTIPYVSAGLRMLGNMLVPLPGGPEITAGESLPRIMLKGAVRGAEAGAMQPVSGDNFAAEKLRQTGIGAAIGAAAPPVVAGAGKVYNAAAGNIPQAAKDVMTAGRKFGVRLFPGDISREPMQQKAEVLLESVPVVGTAGERAAQHGEAKAAAEALQQKHYEKFLDTDSEDFKDVIAAAAKGDQRARNLVDKLQNAGADPDKNMQASIGLSDFRTRQTAEQLYDRVENLAQEHQLGDVPLDSTTQAIDRSLEELNASKIRQPELIGLLKEIRGNITPKKITPTNQLPLLGASGEPLVQAPAAPPVDNSYQAIRKLRSDLGDRIRSYYQGANAIIGEKGVGYLERTQNAIEDDLRRYAQQSGVPEIQAAGQQADQYYRTARVPFKDGQLAQAAISTEPDQIYQQFIKAGKGDRAQKFYTALDERGRAAVKYSMVADAINKATDPARDIFSPQKFFSSLNKIDDAYGVFFKGPDKFELDGFKNLMRHVTRAGQFAENPPTGQRVVPLLLAGEAARLNLPVTAGLGTLFAVAKPLMMSDAGKRLLLAAARMPAGSPALANLYQQILTTLPQLGAKAATQAGRRPLSDFHLPAPTQQQ